MKRSGGFQYKPDARARVARLGHRDGRGPPDAIPRLRVGLVFRPPRSLSMRLRIAFGGMPFCPNVRDSRDVGFQTNPTAGISTMASRAIEPNPPTGRINRPVGDLAPDQVMVVLRNGSFQRDRSQSYEENELLSPMSITSRRKPPNRDDRTQSAASSTRSIPACHGGFGDERHKRTSLLPARTKPFYRESRRRSDDSCLVRPPPARDLEGARHRLTSFRVEPSQCRDARRCT